jgi:hypothetical protein
MQLCDLHAIVFVAHIQLFLCAICNYLCLLYAIVYIGKMQLCMLII